MMLLSIFLATPCTHLGEVKIPALPLPAVEAITDREMSKDATPPPKTLVPHVCGPRGQMSEVKSQHLMNGI